MATYGQAVGDWLKAAMAAARLTSKEKLAELSGVERSTVYEIYGGRAHPSAATVTLLAKALKQDGPVFLLGNAQEPADVSGWIGRAQAALDRAAGLLRDPTLSQAEEMVSEVETASGAGKGQKPPAPPASRPRKPNPRPPRPEVGAKAKRPRPGEGRSPPPQS